MLTSFSFAPLIGMHVCPTWDERFGRQRIRFRRNFSTSEYGTGTRYPYHLTIERACIKQYRLQLALGGTEALYIVKTFSNTMRLSLGSAISFSEPEPDKSLFILQRKCNSIKCLVYVVKHLKNSILCCID
jgi:hypothetical protein